MNAKTPKEDFDSDFEVDVLEDAPEVDVVDDTPPEDRGRQLLPPDEEDLDPLPDDELESYSERVRKRISEATFKFNDQRRKREAAEREAAEAAKIAKAAIEHANQVRRALSQYEKFGVDQAKSRVEVELMQARAAVKEAMELGDADKLAEATERVARLAPQHEQFSRYAVMEHEDIEYPQPQPQTYGTDPRQQEAFGEWHSRNQWFGTDPQMTLFARGWHSMVAEANPQAVGTPEYYAEIDRIMRENFPDRFEQGAPQGRQARTQPDRADNQRASPVTPVTRASPSGQSKGGKKKVTLTQSQLRLANRLGLTPQQYAESLLEMEKNQ